MGKRKLFSLLVVFVITMVGIAECALGAGEDNKVVTWGGNPMLAFTIASILLCCVHYLRPGRWMSQAEPKMVNQYFNSRST